MLSGDNSILSQAGRAKDITGEKSIAEKVQLAYMSALANGQGEVTEGKLKDELDKEFGQDGYKLSEDLTKVIIDEKEYDVGGAVTGGGSGLIQQADGTFKDSSNNEWVWIEVPKTVTANVTEDNDIYDALRDYCKDVIAKTGTDYKTTTCGWTDEWYAWDTTNNKAITEATITDEEQKKLKNGCGLSLSEYNATKHEMLNSIKENGGFYIGKYETGNQGGTAVIKQNQFPYNWVTCSQAQNLAKGFTTDGKTASLLFGIQWDLVLKFLSVKGEATNFLNDNSTSWGNYYNNTYNITNTEAWYSTDYGANWTKGAYNKNTEGEILLTTGAHSSFSKQKIYDLAGNVYEWTLEKTSNSSNPCALRGGLCYDDGDYCPASVRVYSSPTSSGISIGFRVALY